MKTTVSELLIQRDKIQPGTVLTVVGFLAVGAHSRLYETAEGPSIDESDFVPIADERVGKALLASVPAYSGGPHIYNDRAEIIAVADVAHGALVLSRIQAITIFREVKWHVELEVGAPSPS